MASVYMEICQREVAVALSCNVSETGIGPIPRTDQIRESRRPIYKNWLASLGAR